MSLAHTEIDADESDIRPVVAGNSGNGSVWIFGAGVIIAAGFLFYTLENRRAALNSAEIETDANRSAGLISPPPLLAIPPSPLGWDNQETLTSASQIKALDTTAEARPTPSPRTVSQPAPVYIPAPPQSYVPVPNPVPSVVFEAPNARPAQAGSEDQSAPKDERVLASRFKNPSTTIPKGVIIQAVLETALDSTRAGFARAIISRDVFSFDGKHILVPRGSRLIGEYKADLSPGQKRALIQWQRLMRPDGILINIDSPAADPLGRAGVRGKVNSHFFERFGGAILQSSLDVGVQLATSRATNGVVIYGLPTDLRGAAAPATEKVQPTLTVRQGTSVSVFVAKDLDFSTVEQ